jgi:hypothetical protein
MQVNRYEDITFDMLGTRRARPMNLSKFARFRSTLDMKNYPKDTAKCAKSFLIEIDRWINLHKFVKYIGLESLPHQNVILGTTHQLDELHQLYGNRIATYVGEYKYHRRLTDFKVKQINHYSELSIGDVFIVSYPSCITTNYHPDFKLLLDHCLVNKIPVHIDGAWFGQCRNFELDVTHPAIESVSVSLSKALAMGSQRIGIRYSRNKILGPISIMNDFEYCNVSDMWIGIESMRHFGPDYWWSNYSELYSKVCNDFNLEEADSIHVGWLNNNTGKHQFGVRTPLRMLIEGIFDERGTDNGLNKIEREERR